MWFGKRLYVLPGEKVATGTDGALAVEEIYMERPMGYHIRDGGKDLHDDVWKDHAQRKKIFDYCPELSLIMDMKLERERCEGDDKEGTLEPAVSSREPPEGPRASDPSSFEETRSASPAVDAATETLEYSPPSRGPNR